MDINKLHFCQLIKQADGSRSEPIAITLLDLAKMLSDSEWDELEECYVLVIGSAEPEDDDSMSDWFSGIPLVGKEAFCKYILGQDIRPENQIDIEEQINASK